VAGWAFSRRAPIARVEVAVAGSPPVPLAHGGPRPDVAALYGCDAACGFAGTVSLGERPAGSLILEVAAIDARGGRAARRVTVLRGDDGVSPPVTARAKEDEGEAGVERARAVAGTAPAIAAGVAGAAGELSRLLASVREERDREATLLDATGLGLAAALPSEAVVTPLDRTRLPYAEQSVDVVVIDDGGSERVAAARRLAEVAVALVRPHGGLEMMWRAAPMPSRWPRTSLVIPVFNQSACTDACLNGVLETWPAGLDGEVLVVDDGSTDDTAALLERWSARDARVRAVRRPENGGFIAAGNAGAAAATGEVLVFLNNDTIPQPGWLPPLLTALGRAQAGAVGGKLLYPDGRLQEAGGVIFSDGDGCNFGKGDPEPSHPLFGHVREVDYCSGALLATRRQLFLALGGFDSAFAPAYYEDTDYAFRLRQQGYRVYYQPASVVLHVEGATAGREVDRGVKRYQARNRATFAARWADALRAQPPHPPAIDRAALHRLHVRGGETRRALVVLPTMPEPDRESGSRRAFHLIELLLEAEWAVSVIVENATGGERYARALRQLGAATYAGAMTRNAGAAYLPDLSALATREPFDLALLAFWHVAERHLPTLRTVAPRTRVLVDSVDLHFLRQARGAFTRARSDRARDALDGRFADELRRELNVYGTADGVLTVSDKEAGWIDDLVGVAGHAFCVPDLEDVPGRPLPLEDRRGLLFLGNFRHPPNIEALGFLAEIVRRLDPGLLAAHPLSIVGNALSVDMLGPLADHPHVHAVGWVPSVQPYLERARMSVLPLRHGAGTKRKLLQSLLFGTPCVSTSVGIEGFGLENDRDVLVADTAEAFAAAIRRLASDDETWRALARNGRAAVESAHGRDVVRARLAAAVGRVTSPAASGSFPPGPPA